MVKIGVFADNFENICLYSGLSLSKESVVEVIISALGKLDVKCWRKLFYPQAAEEKGGNPWIELYEQMFRMHIIENNGEKPMKRRDRYIKSLANHIKIELPDGQVLCVLMCKLWETLPLFKKSTIEEDLGRDVVERAMHFFGKKKNFKVSIWSERLALPSDLKSFFPEALDEEAASCVPVRSKEPGEWFVIGKPVTPVDDNGAYVEEVEVEQEGDEQNKQETEVEKSSSVKEELCDKLAALQSREAEVIGALEACKEKLNQKRAMLPTIQEEIRKTMAVLNSTKDIESIVNTMEPKDVEIFQEIWKFGTDELKREVIEKLANVFTGTSEINGNDLMETEESGENLSSNTRPPTPGNPKNGEPPEIPEFMGFDP